MTRLVAFFAGLLLGWYARQTERPVASERELCRDPLCWRDLGHAGPHRPLPWLRDTLRTADAPSWTGTRIVNNSTIRDQAPADEPGGGW